MVSKGPREVSTIAFPYGDLDDAIDVARALHSSGGVPLSRDQLAAVMKLEPGGGGFNTKAGAARNFGLMETVQGKYQLTQLGFDILDSARERAAKAQAFLFVPLYRRVYEEFKGRQLPTRPVGLETAFVSFGVALKQKDKARQVFERSARLAGFFPNAQEDRLVEPIVGLTPLPPMASAAPHVFYGGGPDTQETAATMAPVRTGLNPFIEGLLSELPEKGEMWSIEEQGHWLQAAAQIFRILYKGDGEITVTVKKTGGANDTGVSMGAAR